MTFAQTRREIFEAVFLGLDHFERTCTYVPAAGGAARTVKALLRPSEDWQLGEQSLREVDVITVTLSNDPTSAVGGVARPELGDVLVDPDGRRYSWTGQVLSQTPHSWRLQFQAARQRQAGAQSLQR